MESDDDSNEKEKKSPSDTLPLYPLCMRVFVTLQTQYRKDVEVDIIQLHEAGYRDTSMPVYIAICIERESFDRQFSE